MDEDLLADLEDLGEEYSDNSEQNISDTSEINREVIDAHSLLVESVKGVNEVQSLVKVYSSNALSKVLKNIEGFLAGSRSTTGSFGPVENDPEYETILSANSLSFELDNEIIMVQKLIREYYSSKFRELADLVPNPLEYATAVKMIGNEMDINKIDLKSLLPAATIMVINVTATTTSGKPLSDVELKRVIDACDIAINLSKSRQKLLEYVETRMSFIAPNLTNILGSGIAAKLIGISGGLTNLSKIPADNIMVLGKSSKTNMGLSSVYMGKHCGVVYQCDLVSKCPLDIQRKAARLVSAKCALASRIDAVRESVDGSQGFVYRNEIQKKIDALLQPLNHKRVKALPVPKEEPTKRRGGKRARKAKERMAATTLQKEQNRMKFGEQEQELVFGDEETIGLGLIGGSTGRVRAAHADPRIKGKFLAIIASYSFKKT